MAPKTKTWRIATLGSILALVFVVFSLFKLGWVPVALFALWSVLAISDASTGKISIGLVAPVLILQFVYYREIFFFLYGPLFAILLGIWLIVRFLQKSGLDFSFKHMDPEKNYFGFGDVLGVPFALSLSQILLPFWGLVIFAAGMAAIMPVFMRKKSRRFLPWLTPPLILIFVVSVLL